VTNPGGLLGGGVTTLNRPAPPPKPAWPAGTSVSASSFHGPNNGSDGRPRTYDPANAIDGNTDTFWNDDTFGGYPDVLTITASDPVTLPGITLLSNADGVPQDFTVDVWDGAAWQPAATVSGNTDVQRAVPFAQPVATSQVRITVTRDQQTPSGEFTRISEVWPGVVAADLPGTDQFAVPATPVTWTDTRGCQSGTKVCADGLHGFRYLKVRLDALPGDAPEAVPYGQVGINGVALSFTPYLGTPGRSSGNGP